MFSWFTGGEDKPKTVDASQTPGFHPISILPTTTPADQNVAPVKAAASPSAPPATLAPSLTGPPLTDTTPEAEASATTAASVSPSSFLFDGMDVGKSRRRRPHVSSSSSPSASGAAAIFPIEASPETATADPTRVADSPPPSSSLSSPEKLRQRLENFYRFYNPAKLAHVEMIVEAYRGRETQLFEELVRRYGPEPVERSTAHPLKQPSSSLSLSQSQSQSPPHGEAAPSGSEVSAFRFISPTAEAAVAMWASPPTEDDTAVKKRTSFASAPQPPATGAVKSGEATSTNVLSWPLSSSPPSLLHAATDVSATTQQSNEVTSPAEAAAAAASPSTLAAPPSQEEGHVTPPLRPTRPSPPVRPSSSSCASSSDEAEETQEERHRRELRASQGCLLEARAALAALLREARLALQQRQEKIAHIHALEAQIQDCVRAEEYREADALSDEVTQTADSVQRCDDVWMGLGRRVLAAQRRLEEAVRALASLLRTHEEELQTEEEAEQTRVQSQLHRDNSDLRLREERALVSKKDLAMKHSAAESRLQAARASQSDVLRRMQATLGSTLTQQESLTRDVSQLDRQIDELKAQLRQLEEKRTEARAQLSKLTDKLLAAKAAHSGELDAAAAVVDGCEREMECATQQWKDVEAEEASIAAERAAREAAAAALLKAMKDHQEEREAVHLRTRALEQDTIPVSDRYWKAWQNLFSARLRGADVLFEIPAAAHPDEAAKSDGPSPLTKKANLLKQLDELTGELHAEEELLRDAQHRLEVCEARVAPLTAAKSAAVANKNFKAAQQCADELKVVQVTVEGCQGDVDLYGGQVRALERTIGRLRADLAAVEAETQRYAADFKREYAAAMNAFDAAVVHPPDYVQLPPESQGADELADAAAALQTALREEWQRVATNGGGVTRPDAESEARAAAASAESSAQEPAAVASTTATSAAAAGEAPVEFASAVEKEAEMRRRLAALQSQLERAIAREAFDECDVVQQQVDQLKAQLVSLSQSTPEENGEAE